MLALNDSKSLSLKQAESNHGIICVFKNQPIPQKLNLIACSWTD